MEILKEAWEYFLFASVVVFPHLLGILLFYRLHWAPRWIARTAAIIAPAVIFFWLAWIVLFGGLRGVAASGMTCGNAVVFAGIFVLFGTGVQLVLGAFTHVVLIAFRR